MTLRRARHLPSYIIVPKCKSEDPIVQEDHFFSKEHIPRFLVYIERQNRLAFQQMSRECCS